MSREGIEKRVKLLDVLLKLAKDKESPVVHPRGAISLTDETGV
jgi:hypothetical protein